MKKSEWVIGLLDDYTTWLGLGCLISWICLLRFLKIHEKFFLLLSTLYHSFGDVLAFIFCVLVLFMGFWICGYVVLGPCHVKFQTPSAAMEWLASMVTGEEIFMTLASVETHKVGNMAVLWFSRVYVVVFFGMFTVIVLNVLVEIFNSSYDVIMNTLLRMSKADNLRVTFADHAPRDQKGNLVGPAEQVLACGQRQILLCRMTFHT
ncbi:mucolipin-1-like isoform X2 [Dreissena polymorpha]|uniref:mucolipin-1-like isoform X2 n=1 Tax=Dreissena polymorpha TaxID=45954 RepID=UPI00226557E9|nr:mucolipin-1-like isoform X2 [Dreissena polymorpha]